MRAKTTSYPANPHERASDVPSPDAPRASTHPNRNCDDIDSLAAALRAWSAAHGRRPDWRTGTSLYRLAVAEILLQKTKAADAEPVWKAVTRIYPDAASLFNADDEQLCTLVRHLGLGQQRVQRLKAMARALFGGEDLSAIPGLGDYGRAILNLAKGEVPHAGVVDGNVARVVCRTHGLTFERGEPRKKREVREAADRLLRTQPNAQLMLELVYAVVDLGALVCRPQRPLCSACPLAGFCSLRQRTAE